MREIKFEINVGDVVFEASKTYNKVFGWKISEIKLEKYIVGWKTIVKLAPVYNVSWNTTKFLSDVLHMYETKDDAEKAMNGETVETIDEISTLK